MKPILLLTLSLLCLLATFGGCSRVYIFAGIVMDVDGGAIEGAAMDFYPHGVAGRDASPTQFLSPFEFGSIPVARA